jgi:hypothetical protein
MEDPCLYATNPLFGADGEGAKFPIESPSVARARWVGLPEMPNCSVSASPFRLSNIFRNEVASLFPIHGGYNTVWREAVTYASLLILLHGIFYRITLMFTVYYLSMWVEAISDFLCKMVR